MSTEPFSDEILSAIIDGEADEQTIASVENDPEANARLMQMRRAVEFVAAPVPDASPERRSASIAAAMAAATPVAPEVTSLSAARHERRPAGAAPATDRRQWLALAAAAVALIVAIPLVLQFRSDNDSLDVAAEADTSDSQSLSVDDAAESPDGGDAMDDGDADAMESAMAESAEAMADDAMEEDGDTAAEEEPMEEEANDGEAADDVADEPVASLSPIEAVEQRLAQAASAGSVDDIVDLIRFGSIAPTLTLEQVAEAGLSPECVDAELAELSPELVDLPIYDVFFLTVEGGEEQLAIIRFNEDETTTTLDAEDCAQLG